MIQKVFTIYDQAAKAYLPPFFTHSLGIAVRQFKDACNNPEHQFGRHPEDYVLYEIGTFDDESGALVQEKFDKVHTGVELIIQKSFALGDPMPGHLDQPEALQEAEVDKQITSDLPSWEKHQKYQG